MACFIKVSSFHLGCIIMFVLLCLVSVHIVSCSFTRLALIFHTVVTFGVSGTLCGKVLVMCELTVYRSQI